MGCGGKMKRGRRFHSEEPGYGLRLGDGDAWFLTASADARDWLDRFARILGLEGGTGSEPLRIVFSRGSNPHGEAHPPVDPWDPRRRRTVRVRCADKACSEVLCEILKDTPDDVRWVSMWSALMPIYRRARERGGLPLHAALAERDAKGVLLAAPGGTGKSTACRRMPAPWIERADDETLVVRTRKGGYRAHPFPTWSDFLCGRVSPARKVERSVPVQAVFFLEQSEKDDAAPLGQAEAAVMLNGSAVEVCSKYWLGIEKEDEIAQRRAVFANACDFARRIPAYALRLSLHGRFWEEIEKALDGRLLLSGVSPPPDAGRLRMLRCVETGGRSREAESPGCNPLPKRFDLPDFPLWDSE